MNVFHPRRLLAACMLLTLTLALFLQLAGAPLPMKDSGMMQGMTMTMQDHCDDCAATAPHCADSLCSGPVAMAVGDTLPLTTGAPRAEHARVPCFHAGISPAPELQPPRLLLTA